MKHALILFCFIAVSWCVHGQPYTTFNYSVPEGFPSVEIYDVHQDRKGFLWFSSDNGVIRFDGKQIESFHVKDGLSDPVVFGFSEDHRGRIWFRTFSGKISYYDQGKIVTYPHNDKLAHLTSYSIIQSLHCDSLDQLWFTAGKFFCKIDKEGNLEVQEAKADAFQIRKLGDRFLVCRNGIAGTITNVTVGDESFPMRISDPLKQNPVFCAVTWNGNQYYSTNTDIFEYDGKILRRILAAKSNIISLSTDTENNLWVGYQNGGAERYSTSDFKDPWIPTFLANKSVTKVLQDHEGGFWFTTLERGAYYVPNLQIRNFSISMDPKIKTIVPAGNTIMMGDHTGNMYTLDAEFKPHKKKSLGLPILTSMADRQKRVWVSTLFDLWVLDSALNVKKMYSAVNAIDFSEDKDGCIWTYGGTRMRKFTPDLDLAIDKSIRFLYRSLYVDDSLILLSGRVGLRVLNKSFDLVNTPQKLSNLKITDIANLNDSTFLISTMGTGFWLLNKRTWESVQFDAQNRFIANNVYCTYKNDSTLWLGTEKGVARINIRSLVEDDINFDYLTKSSGLVNNKINFLVPHGNSILAFADDGVSLIPHDFNKFATKKPIFYLREMLVNNQPVDTTQEINLSYDKNNVELTFGYISFNNHNIFVRYRLSESDPWLYTSSQRLQFSSLAPRSYSIELEYSTDNVQWILANDNRIEFTIAQPWWKVWYYQLPLVLVFVLIGYVYFRNRLAFTQQKQKYLEVINQHQQKLLQTEINTTERERGRIAKDLHDTVGTNLVALKMIIGQLLQKHQDPLADQIENQLQGVIHETKEIIYNLTPPGIERYGLFILLKNQIDKVNRMTSTAINFTPYGKDVHNQSLNLVILRVIQELISNSLKHARARNINIYISTFEDRINIIYEDDGIGFSHTESTRGFGLHNIESRIEAVKGMIKFESGDFGISYNIDIPFAN
jgi:signal transduction histidine kinase/ligand-binding sensor domain-containing protein